MNDDDLKRVVLAATFEEDGRRKLTCAEAFRLSAKHDVELLDIARICNREGVRFCRCQLGCFK